MSGMPSKKTKPWGLEALKRETLEQWKRGEQAPSALLANALAIAAGSELDLERLGARPQPLSEAGRALVSRTIEKSRIPGADLGAILEELLGSAWAPKKPAAPKAPPAPARSESSKPAGRPSGKHAPAGKPAAKAAPVVVVRKASSKLAKG